MPVTNIAGRSGLQIQSLVELRRQLDDLQRQIGTGQKANTYAGLGPDRGLAMELRAQLAAIRSFDAASTTVSTRLTLALTALTQIDKSARAVRTATSTSNFSLDQTGQTPDQHAALGQLEQMLDALNTRFGDQYIFSGKSPDRQSVASAGYILNGDATHAGFKQIVAERAAADLGADGRGRLDIASTPPATVELAEDAASPFGLKLAAVSSTLTGAGVTPPAGSPAAMAVDFSAATLAEGDAISLRFNLPDGTSEEVTLTATTANPPGKNQFTIGGSAAATAANFEAALTAAVETVAGTSLKAASAMAAANDFFNTTGGNPPKRIPSPPGTATALVDGTTDNTVIWYTGETGSDPARTSATARVDPSVTIAFGMRADEQALRTAVASVAVFAVMSYSPGDPAAKSQYSALTTRIGASLSAGQGEQKISDILTEMANAQLTADGARIRHQQKSSALIGMLDSVAGVSPEQVGAQLLALQTRLEASLQTTAVLSRISLVNYLD